MRDPTNKEGERSRKKESAGKKEEEESLPSNSREFNSYIYIRSSLTIYIIGHKIIKVFCLISGYYSISVYNKIGAG